VGAAKVDAAAAALGEMNPDVRLEPLPLRLDAGNLDSIVRKSDVVLDCSDNFATRHAINRACVRQRKPLVSGAAIRFDGQLMVFDFRDANGACYSCLFPEDAEVDEVQCSTMGVFAPLTGIIGAMQAMEAIKLVIGAGESLNGRLLIFDAKNADWRSLRVKKDPACKVCGAG
jgi:molybdopterin-synthase adenylyltransferase